MVASSAGQVGKGELEGLNDGRLETYSSTHSRFVVLSTTGSEYISTKDVPHALEIRSVLAECDTTDRQTLLQRKRVTRVSI